MQAAVSNRRAAERAFLDRPRSRRNTQEIAGSLLSFGEIMGEFNLIDHNDGKHFLASEVDSRVEARTYLDRKNN